MGGWRGAKRGAGRHKTFFFRDLQPLLQKDEKRGGRTFSIVGQTGTKKKCRFFWVGWGGEGWGDCVVVARQN